MSVENWVAIPGHPLYQVSDQGSVRSMRTRGGISGRRIKTDVDRYGYLRVRFYEDGCETRLLLHQVVISAFRGPAPEGMVTRHLNGIKEDCRLQNLQYGTQGQNALDTVAHGRHYWANRTHCSHGHEYTPENTHYYASRGNARWCVTCERRRVAATRSRQVASTGGKS